MGCVNNIVKYILFAVNAVFSLFAIVFIVCGALILYFNNDIPDDKYMELYLIPIMIIVCGCLLFLITVFGCCGAIAEKSCLLLLYIVFMILLLSGNIYIAVQISAIKLVEILEDALNNMFNDSSTRESFFLIETLFQCCGTTGADSYENLNVTLSITCCPLPDLSELELCSKEDAYTGCTQILINLMSFFYNGVFYAVITVIVLEAIGVVLSLYLMYDFSKKKKLAKPLYPPLATNRSYY